MNALPCYLFTLLTVLLTSCSDNRAFTKPSGADPGKQIEIKPTANNTETAKAPPVCQPDLWKRVYDPTRLEVVDQCKEVTGVIEELDQNEDGDTHMLLNLDPGQEDLVNKRNRKKKDGDLVVEVVCGNAITDKKVGDTCKGYTNEVHIPKVDDHVKVTGSYVIDSHNGWAEIHPASKIEIK